jgi:hypothetical protein
MEGNRVTDKEFRERAMPFLKVFAESDPLMYDDYGPDGCQFCNATIYAREDKHEQTCPHVLVQLFVQEVAA